MAEITTKSTKIPVAPLGLFLLLLFAYLPVLVELVEDWYADPNYSHGFLILPISGFLIWKNRKNLAPVERPSSLGVVILGGGLLMLILASAAAEYFTIRFSFAMSVTGLGLFCLGWQNFRENWFSFFFLLFMIPIPGVIYYSATMPMQLLSSKMAYWALTLAGIPANLSGNIITLPNYRLEVAEACSGLRSLVTLMALGALYARLTLKGIWRPVFLFLATIPIAIAANIFRIFATGVGAHKISPKVAEDFLHEISGLLVFFAALVMTITLAWILGWTKKAP